MLVADRWRSPSSASVSAEFRIRSKKQIADGRAHPQCERATALAPLTVVQHMAALIEGLETTEPVITAVVVEKRCGQHHLGRPSGLILGKGGRACRACERPRCPLRQVFTSSSRQRPSPRWNTKRPCGRRHCSRRPLARPKRREAEICGQSIELSHRRRRRIGITPSPRRVRAIPVHDDRGSRH